ncbi:MAG: hypothetical protein ABFD50_02020 [Smithella sp.]
MIKSVRILLLTVAFILMPLLDIGIAGEAISNVSGKYAREAKYENAKFEVKQLSNGKVHVTGLALWGTDRSSGPDIGQLDFVAPIKSCEQIKFVKGKTKYQKVISDFVPNEDIDWNGIQTLIAEN